jgi:hypothetical protein
MQKRKTFHIVLSASFTNWFQGPTVLIEMAHFGQICRIATGFCFDIIGVHRAQRSPASPVYTDPFEGWIKWGMTTVPPEPWFQLGDTIEAANDS